ncbi:MAG: hypothetical protein ACYCST_04390 [Acidimicrobiales bacterium]
MAATEQGSEENACEAQAAVHNVRTATKAPCAHRAAEGLAGWAAVLGTTAAWDLWALRGGHTTLSTAYGTAARHPLGRVALLAADAVLLAHLWGWPRAAGHFDPFAMAARRLSSGAEGR